MNVLAERNQKIELLEGILLRAPQKELVFNHYFAPGVYVREMVAPADTFIIGAEHKTECLNILLSGSCRILADDRTVSMFAPDIFRSFPGVRKVAYTAQGMRWLNVFATTETDLQKLEEQLIIKSDTYLLHEEDKKRLEAICPSLS